MGLKKHLSLFTFVFVLGGCSGGGGAGSATGSDPGAYPTSASCDTIDVPGSLEDQCRDWDNPSGNANLSVSCDGMGGAFSTSACPTANRQGSCVVGPTAGITATYRYFQPIYDPTSAQTHCNGMSGVFTAN